MSAPSCRRCPQVFVPCTRSPLLMTLSYFTNVMLEEGNRDWGMLVGRSSRGDCVSTGLVHGPRFKHNYCDKTECVAIAK